MMTTKPVRCSVAALVFAGVAGLALAAEAAPVHLIMNLSVKPDKQQEFLDVMKKAAPDTRGFKGNMQFDILVDPAKPGHVTFYEVWASPEAMAAYREFRTKTNFIASIQPFIAGPTQTVMYEGVDY